MTTAPIFKLTPGIQSYAWGKKGSSSLAAQLAETCIPGFQVDEDKAYAELWMGTHPTLPSTLADKTLLSEQIKSNSKLIGQEVINAFPDSAEGDLPFLFKVLSIGTALSIQAHPDKELGKRLFKEKPEVYKDANHKPEMAIALTPFTAFLNFLPLQNILMNLLSIPELERLIPQEVLSQFLICVMPPKPGSTYTISEDQQKFALREVFGALMTASPTDVEQSIKDLVKRYKENKEIGVTEKDLVELTLMLNEQYPGDVGILCVFLLNVVELKPGEAAFLGANVPHAYITGDIIECMATSDNVVRAGLTPKLRDVDTLINMLTYEAGPGSKQLLQPTPYGNDSSTLLYNPPIEEFSVLKIALEKGEATVHGGLKGPSICIVTEGNGSAGEVEFKRGDVIFVGAGEEVKWNATEKCEVFRAFVEA